MVLSRVLCCSITYRVWEFIPCDYQLMLISGVFPCHHPAKSSTSDVAGTDFTEKSRRVSTMNEEGKI